VISAATSANDSDLIFGRTIQTAGAWKGRRPFLIGLEVDTRRLIVPVKTAATCPADPERSHRHHVWVELRVVVATTEQRHYREA
jgi:hypothetical protein